MIVCRYDTTKECDGIMKNCIKCSMVEELEKIKTDIEEYMIISFCEDDDIKNIRTILDNHIKELKGENKKECSTCKSDSSLENCLGCIEYGHWELKGENKQSRCNSCQNNTDELSGECYECVKGIKDNYIAELKGEQK